MAHSLLIAPFLKPLLRELSQRSLVELEFLGFLPRHEGQVEADSYKITLSSIVILV